MGLPLPNSYGSFSSPLSGLSIASSSLTVLASLAFIETTTWYPDSSVTNHVCHNASLLHDSSEYLGITPLFMGDDTCANITRLGYSVIFTSRKLLHLTMCYMFLLFARI